MEPIDSLPVPAQGDDGEVGYGKPPKHTRFKKGQSGNPKGRPKGISNLATVLEKAAREKVIVTEHGRRKAITKLEAAVIQVMNKAAGGDLKAFAQLARLTQSTASSEPGGAPSLLDHADDQQVVLRLTARLLAAVHLHTEKE